MTDTIFSTTPNLVSPTGDPLSPTNPTIPTPSLVDQLVGEGKKFKTVEALAAAKSESDRFIDELKGELATLREDFSKRSASLDQLDELRTEIQRLKQLQQTTNATPRDTNTTPSLTDERIQAIVAETITANERKATVTQNIQEAVDTAVKAYGTTEAATKAVQDKAQELRVTTEYLQNIAATSPSAFFKVMGLDGAPGKSDTNIIPKGSINTEVIPTTGGLLKPGTKAYFDNIRKTNKEKYFSPAITAQIMKAREQGTYLIA